MTKGNSKDNRQLSKLKETQFVKEQLWTDRIVRWIIITILVLSIFAMIFAYFFITGNLKAIEPGSSEIKEVTIPIGSSSSDVAQILQDNQIIKHAEIFTYYLKFNNKKELQAGHYQFSPSMDADQVIETLQEGGDPIFVDADTKLTVIEGMQLEEIADLVGDNTGITADEFMKVANDKKFLEELQTKYPSFLEDLLDHEGVKYVLEGYIYPATYDYFAGMTAEELIIDMVGSANLVYHDLADDLVNTNLSYHEILTLASIIEREADKVEDRGLISGVFYNRMAIGMALETDISILYALGVHKDLVTYDDLEVDSPYNLYKNIGLAPGPMNSPSRTAIEAAIYPTWNDYYYFVADIETGDIYYSYTFEEHESLVEIYVNSRQNEQIDSTETDENQQVEILEDISQD